MKSCDGCSKDWGSIYSLGVIGAGFYFVQGVSGFGPVVVAIAKAFFWPAFAVFKVLGLLGV